MKVKVLFIPGYMGSILEERHTKKVRWVRVSDFFSNFWDLSMTETYSDLPKKNDLVPGELLFQVRVIPKILEVESYNKTFVHLEKFCTSTKRELHYVTFDWREDFYHGIQRIHEKVEELTKDGSQLEIVAHSTGGYLASYYMRYGANDFFEAQENWSGALKVKKFAIVASPLRGALSLLKHINEGTPALRNKKLCGSLDYSTFKSSYFFIPHKDLLKFQIIKGRERKLVDGLDLSSVESYKKNQWGPFKPEHLSEIPVVDKKLQQIIERGKKFQELMLANVEVKPAYKTKILVLRGEGRPTYFYPTIKENDLNKTPLKISYKRSERIDGDGIVSALSSKPLDWFNEHELKVVTNSEEHLKIISNYHSQKIIHQFLEND